MTTPKKPKAEAAPATEKKPVSVKPSPSRKKPAAAKPTAKTPKKKPVAKKAIAAPPSKKAPAKKAKKKRPPPRKALTKSKSGKTVEGKRKLTNAADSRGPNPIVAETGIPTEEHIAQALADGLTMDQINFYESYMTCRIGVRAYLAIHPDVTYASAAVQASRQLNDVKGKAYLAKRMAEAFAKVEGEKTRLQSAITDIAFADANELVEYRRNSCRFCWGKDHLYQFTPAQMERAREEGKRAFENNVDRAKALGITITDEYEFDELGGSGFHPHKTPNPECPECFGEGEGDVFFKDTRFLSPAANMLYDGAAIDKNGMKINMASRDGARNTLAKIYKLTDDAPKITMNVSAEVLDALFGTSMEKSRSRTEEVQGERSLPGSTPD